MALLASAFDWDVGWASAQQQNFVGPRPNLRGEPRYYVVQENFLQSTHLALFSKQP
jgi:hypothetical protein